MASLAMHQASPRVAEKEERKVGVAHAGHGAVLTTAIEREIECAVIHGALMVVI